MSKEAMKLALEALETLHDENMDYLTRNKLGGENNQCMVFAREAITALREALAEPPAQQEPVAYAEQSILDWLADSARGPTAYAKTTLAKRKDGKAQTPLYTSPPAQQEAQAEETVKERTPQERRDAGEWHCPACFTFGHQHRRGCTAAHGIKENT